MSLDTWIAFFVAAWAISLSPGAGAIASMSSGLRDGLGRSLWTILGLQLGVLVHIGLVALGLGALLATSRLGFEIVRWGGVAYLVWLGIAQWRAPAVATQLGDTGTPRASAGALALRGFLVNASNPKAVVFMLAVMPQFLDPAAPLPAQYLALAGTLVAVDVVVMGSYAGLASRVVAHLRDPRQVKWLNRTFGGLFIGAAALLATFKRNA